MPRPRNSRPSGGPPRRDRRADELVIVPLRVTAHDRERLHALAAACGTSLNSLLATTRDVMRVGSCRDCPWSAGDECDHPRTPETGVHHGLVETSTSEGHPSPETCPIRSGGTLVLPG